VKRKPVSVEVTRRNGVRVKVTRWSDGGRVVEADCDCFGYSFRVHTSLDCPNRRTQVEAPEEPKEPA